MPAARCAASRASGLGRVDETVCILGAGIHHSRTCGASQAAGPRSGVRQHPATLDRTPLADSWCSTSFMAADARRIAGCHRGVRAQGPRLVQSADRCLGTTPSALIDELAMPAGRRLSARVHASGNLRRATAYEVAILGRPQCWVGGRSRIAGAARAAPAVAAALPARRAMGRRRMHAVDVEHVAAAAQWAATAPLASCRAIHRRAGRVSS